jgi:hypothetical protein
MASVTPKIPSRVAYAGDGAMNPCGKCGIDVLEICDIRFNIYEEGTGQYINIPLDCSCINIDELSLEEPLDTGITRCVLFFSVYSWDEIKIREVLSKYIIFIDNNILNDLLEDYLKTYTKEIHESKHVIKKIKIFREIYEEFAIVNLKPAKR